MLSIYFHESIHRAESWTIGFTHRPTNYISRHDEHICCWNFHKCFMNQNVYKKDQLVGWYPRAGKEAASGGCW